MSRLSLDVNGAFERAAGGLERSDLEGAADRARSAFTAFEGLRQRGEVGFADLPRDRDGVEATLQLASQLAGRFESLVVLGIGGSSLGGRALVGGLCSPFHNLLPQSKRRGMQIFFPDNSDPATFQALLETLDLERTCFATITKSGGTAETMAQHLVLRQRCVERFGEKGYRERCVMVTDPKKGALRAISATEGLKTLPVASSIGGRFSCLSPVGLLPAACAGIDVRALLAGAAEMEARCHEGQLLSNPALLYATVLHLLDQRKGRRLHVLMPYCDALRDTGDWFVQLWAESLGKSSEVGPTPIRAVGATDQHSSLQLMMQGPHDKVVTLIQVREPRADLTIPMAPGYRDYGELAYLEGHTMGELIEAERRATDAALHKAGRPTINLALPRLDATAMGQLLMMLELATAYAGGLYGVNAFDQPGVEAGKRYAQGLLGRPGYEKYRDELAAASKEDPALKLA